MVEKHLPSFKFLIFCYLALSSTLLFSGISIQTQAQAGFDAVTLRATGVYEAPWRTMTPLAQLDAQTAVIVEGRNAVGHWSLIHTASHQQRGWVESSSLALSNALTLRDLPVIPESLFAWNAEKAAVPLADEAVSLAILHRLSSTPILHNMNTERVHEIFEHGQQLGNRADVFTKIGDSNSTSADFLNPLGMGPGYCQLGSYSYLQETVDYFSAPSSEGKDKNSFTRDSWAAFKGFTSSAAVDPFWAPGGCAKSETPVECEYRLSQASTSIVMLGLMDVRYSTEDVFYQNMERIIQISLDKGVIPVLTTIIVLPDQAVLDYDTMLIVNGAMLDLAEKYEIPLLNLWLALQPLPDYGIGPDRTHLKHEVKRFCSFDGSENEIGGTLRNLLTLQALDELRRNVLTQP